MEGVGSTRDELDGFGMDRSMALWHLGWMASWLSRVDMRKSMPKDTVWLQFNVHAESQADSLLGQAIRKTKRPWHSCLTRSSLGINVASRCIAIYTIYKFYRANWLIFLIGYPTVVFVNHSYVLSRWLVIRHTSTVFSFSPIVWLQYFRFQLSARKIVTKSKNSGYRPKKRGFFRGRMRGWDFESILKDLKFMVPTDWKPVTRNCFLKRITSQSDE